MVILTYPCLSQPLFHNLVFLGATKANEHQAFVK